MLLARRPKILVYTRTFSNVRCFCTVMAIDDARVGYLDVSFPVDSKKKRRMISSFVCNNILAVVIIGLAVFGCACVLM